LGWPKDRLVNLLLSLLLTIHAALLARGAYVNAPTTDELPQLVAAISHWEFGRFELFRVTGPLVRLVAAIPVEIAGYEMDWSGYDDYPGSRAESPLGFEFARLNGQRTVWLVTLARWACIPFSLLGLYICFRWGRELYGPKAGLLAATLWCFSPNILANAQLITTDGAGAALFVTASYVFWHWLRKPRWTSAFLSGLLLALLLLTKATFVIVFAMWPAMWLLCRCVFQAGATPICRTRDMLQLAATLLIAVYGLNLGYGFEGTFRRLGDYEFVCRTFAGPDANRGGVGNRFEGLWLAAIPVPLPENFVCGIDTQKRYFEHSLRSYLRGEWRQGGWWYYYLYAMLIKVPLGTWLFVLLAIGVTTESLLKLKSREERVSYCRNELALLVPLLSVLCLVSSQTGFNKSFRYVLPSLPLLFVWASRAAILFRGSRLVAFRQTAGALCIVLTLAWSVGSSLWYYPHSLSYFNELVGGPKHGHEHLLHSNIDWGQDLLFFDQWLESHQNGRNLYLAYYGYFDPELLGIEFELPPRQLAFETENHHQSEPHPRLAPGLYAVSVNMLRGHKWEIFDGNGGRVTASGRDYSYFLEFEPVAMGGYSIYIYEISEEQRDRLKMAYTSSD